MAESYRTLAGFSAPLARLVGATPRSVLGVRWRHGRRWWWRVRASALGARRRGGTRTAAPRTERARAGALRAGDARSRARRRACPRAARAAPRPRASGGGGTPSERRRILARAAAAQRASAAAADGPSDQVGRWESRAHPVPHLRDQRGHAADRSTCCSGAGRRSTPSPQSASTTRRPTCGTRPRAPAGFTAVRPPKIDIDGDGSSRRRRLFCSGPVAAAERRGARDGREPGVPGLRRRRERP